MPHVRSNVRLILCTYVWIRDGELRLLRFYSRLTYRETVPCLVRNSVSNSRLVSPTLRFLGGRNTLTINSHMASRCTRKKSVGFIWLIVFFLLFPFFLNWVISFEFVIWDLSGYLCNQKKSRYNSAVLSIYLRLN